jgi:hypothetical protein
MLRVGTSSTDGYGRLRLAACGVSQTRLRRPSEVSEAPVPRDTETLLMRRLEKDRAMRPASALELDSQLARVRSWRCLRIIRSATSPAALWSHRAPAPEQPAPLQMKTSRRGAATT